MYSILSAISKSTMSFVTVLLDGIMSLLSTLIEWTMGLLTTVLMTLIDVIAVQIIIQLSGVIYLIVYSMLNIADFCQLVFKKLAGMDYYVYNGEVIEGVDPVISIFMNDAVIQVLLSVAAVAFMMLIIATIIQVIKVEFNSDGKNSKGTIISAALRSMMMFILVPLLCFGGVMISSVLLKSLDNATGGGDTVSISNVVFVSAAYNANRLRLASEGNSVGTLSATDYASIPGVNMTVDISTGTELPGIFGELTGYSPTDDVKSDLEKWALLVDSAFTSNTFSNDVSLSGGTVLGDLAFVMTYYSIWEIDWLIFIAGAFIAMMLMLKVMIGMVIRLYKLAVLFIIAPPIIATTAIKGDSYFSQWRLKFVSITIGAYGPIIGLNIFFLLLPLISNIQLFSVTSFGTAALYGGYNRLFSLIATMVGLYMLSDITKMISGMINAEDAADAGGAMGKKLASDAVKVASVAAGGAGMIGGAVAQSGAVSKLKNADALSSKAQGKTAEALKLEEKAKGYKTRKTQKKYERQAAALHAEAADLTSQSDKERSKGVAQAQRANSMNNYASKNKDSVMSFMGEKLGIKLPKGKEYSGDDLKKLKEKAPETLTISERRALANEKGNIDPIAKYSSDRIETEKLQATQKALQTAGGASMVENMVANFNGQKALAEAARNELTNIGTSKESDSVKMAQMQELLNSVNGKEGFEQVTDVIREYMAAMTDAIKDTGNKDKATFAQSKHDQLNTALDNIASTTGAKATELNNNKAAIIEATSNVALNIDSKNSAEGMSQIVEAVKTEMAKKGTNLSASDLAKIGDLIKSSTEKALKGK